MVQKFSFCLSPPLCVNLEMTSCCLLIKTFFSHCLLDISSCLKLGCRYHLLILNSLDQHSLLRFLLEWQTRSQLLLKKAQTSSILAALLPLVCVFRIPVVKHWLWWDGILPFSDFYVLCLCLFRPGKGMRLTKKFGGEGLFAGTVSNCHVLVTAEAPRGGGRGRSSQRFWYVCTVTSIYYERMAFCTWYKFGPY